MRGEHSPDATISTSLAGSSPHARGAHRLPTCASLDRGIIPACAGSTRRRQRSRRRRRDHPRMRGEHISTSPPPWESGGSSPHARGARPFCGAPGKLHGIIPACAGSTLPLGSTEGRTGDHPRMRGEHCRPVAPVGPLMGSSPHARGARLRHGLRSHARGIIPACAGSTAEDSRRMITFGDHPRMRGEHVLYALRGQDVPGSSPHARGALAYTRADMDPQGIIPACAGSTAG